VEVEVVEYVVAKEFIDWLVAKHRSQLEAERQHELTHVEMETGQLIGASAGVVRFPHHNESPRNTCQCGSAMGKEAIGPVQTRPMGIVRSHEMRSGQAAMVAVMWCRSVWEGVEAALVVNKASHQRGFQRRYALSKVALDVKNGSRTSPRGFQRHVRPQPTTAGRSTRLCRAPQPQTSRAEGRCQEQSDKRPAAGHARGSGVALARCVCRPSEGALDAPVGRGGSAWAWAWACAPDIAAEPISSPRIRR
jgi:hypothetical protein